MVEGQKVFVGVSEDGLGLNGVFGTVTMKVGIVILPLSGTCWQEEER